MIRSNTGTPAQKNATYTMRQMLYSNLLVGVTDVFAVVL